uniref:Uncharacterized protein n=1 Tax=Knipowitschia caucasica TaxID=637954 RepID=A0AAV2J4X8_KNICA
MCVNSSPRASSTSLSLIQEQELQEKDEDDLLEGNEEEQEEGSLEKYFTVPHEDQHSDEEELVEGFSESEIREGNFSPELEHDDPELGQWADGEDNDLHHEKRDSPDREKQINEKFK